MNQSGRPKHSFWEEGKFEKVILENGKTGAYCSLCKKVLRNTAEVRLKMHRNQCLIPSQESSKFISNVSNTDSGNSNIESNNNYLKRKHRSSGETTLELDNTSTECEDTGTPTTLRQESTSISELQTKILNAQSTFQTSKTEKKEKSSGRVRARKDIKNFIDSLNSDEKLTVNKCLVKFLIANNIKFESIESNYFFEFANSLRPAYIPPTATEISTNILDEIYNNTKHEKYAFHGDGILLITVQNNSELFVSMIKHQSGKNLYINTCNNSSNLESFIMDSINIAKEKYGAQIHAVISNTQNFLPLINYSSNINYWFFCCISKNIKSLVNAILDNKFKENVNQIVLEFTKKTNEDLLLERNGVRMMPFNSNLQHDLSNVLLPLLHNLKIIKILFVDHQSKFDQEIFNLIFSTNFELQLNAVIETLKRVLEQSRKETQANYFIADAVEDWISLKIHCQHKEHEAFIDDELKSVLNDISLCAYYLHPVYRGRLLKHVDAEYTSKIHEFFIDQFEEKEMMVLAEFEDGTGLFEKLFNKNYQSPKTFWRIVESTYPDFAKFCNKIHCIPAYTSQQTLDLIIERTDLNFMQEEKVKELYYLLKLNETKRKISSDNNL